MARSNSRGRAPTVSEVNTLYLKLVEAATAALDGEVDDDGVRRPPTAAVLNVARQIVSDARIQPSQDVEEARRDLRAKLPFTAPDPETF
jgi:hypothetical protein